MKISATIITLNEERNLKRALESLTCVDEVVVVDSGSTDRTAEIARGYAARVVKNPWHGYASQKNYAAAQAEHDWILSIDADEALSELLQAEIWQLRQDGPLAAAYRFPRLAQYLGRWIFHSGWYPDHKVRLYDRRRARWTGEFVHESVQVDGPVGELEGRLFHFTCDSIADHLRSMERYTSLAAEELRARGVRAGLARLLLHPPATFFKSYVLQQGFRDGHQGWLIARMAARYTYLKYAKTRALNHQDTKTPR
jgi:glycosyltransferase involved in cell wall biosynthesis